MTLTTKKVIKEMILSEYEINEPFHFIDDTLNEIADSLVPVYNSEVISEWVELPNEFTDTWQEHGFTSEKQTIVSLMTMDLWAYYNTLVRQVWDELQEKGDE